MAASVRPYVYGSIAMGLAAAVAVLTVFPPRTLTSTAPVGAVAALMFVVLVALAEATELRLVRGDSVKAFTLLEAAVVPTLLLFPPGWALLIVLGGVALGQLVRRRPPLQLTFNLGQFAFAGSAAVTVTHVLRGDLPPLSLGSVSAVAVATVAFGLLNLLAVSGVVARLESRSVLGLMREETGLSALNLASNGCLGIIVAVLWVHEPPLLPLVLAPGFAIHLAYRGLLRSDQLLTEMRAQNTRLDRVVQGATDGIVLLDRDGIIEIWNPTMVSLTGIDEDAAMGRAIRQVLDVTDPDGDPADPLAPLPEARPDYPVHVQELELIHRDGGGHRVLATHGFLFDDDGRLIGDVVLLRDVTRQREIEHLKEDFVARVTHELRTPLTPIRGFAESILQHDDDLDAQTRRTMLSRILEQADHMIGLIDDLLLVPQLSGSAARRDLEVIGPGDLLDVVERVAFDLSAPSTDVEIAGVPELPDVVADTGWVELILTHLLSNAAKFAPADSPVEVEVAPQTDERVAVSVTDRGRGIAADQLARIFDRFHRTEQPLTMETGGLGIGLYVARQLARRMGGDLVVESRLGVGSTFTLVLAAAGSKPVRRSTTGTPTAAGRRVPGDPPRARRNGSDPAP